MTEAELLEQESIITKYRRGTLRAGQRRDRVSLKSGSVRLIGDLVWGWGMDGHCCR